MRAHEPAGKRVPADSLTAESPPPPSDQSRNRHVVAHWHLPPRLARQEPWSSLFPIVTALVSLVEHLYDHG